MLGYVKKACKCFNREIPTRKQDFPHAHTKPNFEAKVQFAKEVDDSRLLDEEEKTFVQQVVGTFLFYAKAIDTTMLTPLSAIAETQSKPTARTLEKVRQYLDYALSNPDAV